MSRYPYDERLLDIAPRATNTGIQVRFCLSSLNPIQIHVLNRFRIARFVSRKVQISRLPPTKSLITPRNLFHGTAKGNGDPLL